jgi:hypothetical protein
MYVVLYSTSFLTFLFASCAQIFLLDKALHFSSIFFHQGHQHDTMIRQIAFIFLLVISASSSVAEKDFLEVKLSEDEAFWGRQLLDMGSGTSMPLNPTPYLRGNGNLLVEGN